MFPATTARNGGLFVCVLVLLAMLGVVATPQAQANPRYASIVVDVATGQVLHSSHADATRYPASLTKMMTLYLTFEALEQGRLSMDQRLPVSAQAASMPPSKLGLRAGQSIKVRDAILALIVKSANDVAVVVAEALAGSESRFAETMTAKARFFGMRSTTFRNASGLPDARQVSTARDLSTLSLRVMRDYPQYYDLFSIQSFSYGGKQYRGHNRLLASYAGADGLKTGYIRASGFNLATSAMRDGRRIVSVVLGGRTAQSRDAHMADLLDRGFMRATQLALAVERPVPPVPSPRPGTLAVSDALADAESESPRDVGGMLVSSANAAETEGADAQGSSAGGEDLEPGSWAVQVGAFGDEARARDLASAAASRLSGELSRALIAISEVQMSNTRLFRARLSGLLEAQAREACQSLSQQGMECLVVNPTDG